jgi:hypothetical protein
MPTRLLSLVLLLGCAAAALAALPDHPLKDAQVGDFVLYIGTMSSGEIKGEFTLKLVVIAADEKNVTVRRTIAVNGNPMEPHDFRVDLNVPFDSRMLSEYPNLGNGIIRSDKVAVGKERLKVNGTVYDTEWEKYRIVTRGIDGNPVTTEGTVWQTKSVMLGNVRAEFVTEGQAEIDGKVKTFRAELTIELIAAGKEK